MGTYGYCVLPRGFEPPSAVRGISGSAVTTRPVGSLSVWVSDTARPEPSVEHVKQHNEVVEAAVTQEITPVPLRFGQWSEDGSVFDRIVSDKAAWYEERLKTFSGALEFGIRVVQPGKQTSARVMRVPPEKSGTAYMNALRESAAAAQGERDEAERVRLEITAALGNLVREERVDSARTPHGLISLSHLVARKDFDEYRERIHNLRDQLTELRLLLTGPWVPYSFAS